MASRVSLIQSRSIYVGTLNSVAPSDGYLIVTGSVGIGTTAPASLLQVGTSTNFSISSRTAQVIGSADSETILTVTRSGLDYPQMLDFGVTQSGLYATISARQFTAGETKLVLQPNGGNVGIGTTAPTSVLHVNGANNTAPVRIQAGDNANYYFSGNSTSGYAVDFLINDTAFYIGHNSASRDFTFKTNSIDRVTIKGDGNVGIGTTSPSVKLQVETGADGRLATFKGTAGNTTDFGFDSVGSYIETLGASSGRQKLRIQTYNGSAYTQLFIDGANQYIYTSSNVNVGIGTTSPSSLLSLSKTGLVDFQLNASDQATDEKNWVWQAGAPVGTGVYRLRAVNDAYTNGVNALTFTRSGISSVTATFSSSVEATSFIKTSGTSSQYLMADGSVSTTSNVAPRYVQTINVSQTAYTTICTITGGSLASAVNMSFQGTSNNVVVNVTAQILVNHSGDISITTTSGFYSQLNIRVISNNNETYSVEAQVVSGMASTTDLNIEVFPLNSESVTFGGSPVTPGTTLVHTTRQGLFISASEGISISSGNDIYAAGNVGVGTTSPGAKLVVSGASAEAHISNGDTNTLTLGNFSGGRHFIKSINLGVALTPLTLQASSFTFDTGNVGIGTTSPSTLLHLEKSSSSNNITGTPSIIISNRDSTSGTFISGGIFNNSYRDVSTSSVTAGIWFVNANSPDAGALAKSSDIVFGANSYSADWNTPVERMRITQGGNVGIGTTSPVNKLQVTSATNGVEVLRIDNTAGNSGSVQGVTHLGLNFFAAGNNSGARITAYQESTSGYRGGMYFSTRGVNSDSAPSEAMRISPDQLVGIGTSGTTAADYRLTVDSTGVDYAIYSFGSTHVDNGALGVGVVPSATIGRIDASNDIVAYSTSDQRLKENITPIANALDKVKSLTGVEFDWKEKTKHVHGYEGHDVGVIAQEVQAVLPEAIRTNDSGYLSVRYEKMIALLIEGMKEQQNQIDELKAKLDGLTK